MGWEGERSEEFPSTSVYFFLSGLFCCLGFLGVFFFCCLGGGRFFWLFGRLACFFVWAGGGCRGRVYFFCCLGGGREFTHLPVCSARL